MKRCHKLAAALCASILLLGLTACGGDRTAAPPQEQPAETETLPAPDLGPKLKPIPAAGVDHVNISMVCRATAMGQNENQEGNALRKI